MRPLASCRSVVACCVLLAAASPQPGAEDGYDLWLRYRLVGDAGRLAEYGAFNLLRLIQTGASLRGLAVVSAPKLRLRLLDHWDNLDGTVERGYAGRSLWDWPHLPDSIDPRYRDYARANASLGINGTVLTNVNANATALTPVYLGAVDLVHLAAPPRPDDGAARIGRGEAAPLDGRAAARREVPAQARTT